jgi:hypothetical protein
VAAESVQQTEPTQQTEPAKQDKLVLIHSSKLYRLDQIPRFNNHRLWGSKFVNDEDMAVLSNFRKLLTEFTIDTLPATNSVRKQSALNRLKQVLEQEEHYKAVPIGNIQQGKFTKGDNPTVLSMKQYLEFIKYANGKSFDASCNGVLATENPKLHSIVRQILYNTDYTGNTGNTD